MMKQYGESCICIINYIIHLFVCVFVRLAVRLLTCSSVCLFFRLSVHLPDFDYFHFSCDPWLQTFLDFVRTKDHYNLHMIGDTGVVCWRWMGA